MSAEVTKSLMYPEQGTPEYFTKHKFVVGIISLVINLLANKESEMISAKYVIELTNAKNDEGVEDIIKRLEKKILKQASSGYKSIYVSMSDLGNTEGRIANVIGELNKQGYAVFNDGYGKIIKWG